MTARANDQQAGRLRILNETPSSARNWNSQYLTQRAGFVMVALSAVDTAAERDQPPSMCSAHSTSSKLVQDDRARLHHPAAIAGRPVRLSAVFFSAATSLAQRSQAAERDDTRRSVTWIKCACPCRCRRYAGSSARHRCKGASCRSSDGAGSLVVNVSRSLDYIRLVNWFSTRRSLRGDARLPFGHRGGVGIVP